MKKVLNINLGGIPFTIDQDAYEYLEKYLHTIHRHFDNSGSYDEITADIEARIAELFQELLGKRQIVSLDDVHEVVAIMGSPEDFGADPMEEEMETETEGTHKTHKREYKTGKRLFRDEDDAIIGGVCSGLSTYFGIDDPIWIRLIFAIGFFGFGFGLPIYILLMIIVPKAKSASDKLAMKGEPINFSNIARKIEEEVKEFSKKMDDLGTVEEKVKHFSKKMEEFGQAIKQEFKAKKKRRGRRTNFRSTVKDHFREEDYPRHHGGETLRGLLRAIAIFLGVILLIVFAIVWVSTIAGLIFGFPALSFFLPGSGFLGGVGVFNTFVVISIPLLALALFLFRLFYRVKLSAGWRAGLGAFWIVNLVSLLIVSANIGKSYIAENEVITNISSEIPKEDVISISLGNKFRPKGKIMTNFGDKLIIPYGGDLVNGQVDFFIEKSDDNRMKIIRKDFARGSSSEDAAINATDIDYHVTLEDGELIIPSYFVIPKGKKWRAQQVDMTIKIPVGKAIKLGKHANRFSGRMEIAPTNDHPDLLEGQIWRMGENGLYYEDPKLK